MRTRLALVALLTGALWAVPPLASAAVRTKLDRANGMHFKLEGRDLTLRIVKQALVIHPAIESELYAKRVVIACGTRFRTGRGHSAATVLRWPAGTGRLTVHLRRDVSRRARWCVVAAAHGGDLAFVSFLTREPARLVAKGRTPGGQWWRLNGWRGERREPCVMADFADDIFSQCLDDLAEQRATLGAVVFTPACPGSTFVYGVASRLATSVQLRMADESSVSAAIYERPRGSRMPGRYFMAILPIGVAIRDIRALDASGAVLARKRYLEDDFERTCEVAIPN